jgi:hypothetical protein
VHPADLAVRWHDRRSPARRRRRRGNALASPGRPQRFVGRDQFLAFANAGRAALPVRIDDCREIAIHETSDPDVLVVEYELRGTFTTTGQPGAATFIAVLRIRNGQITLWREYQNTLRRRRQDAETTSKVAGRTKIK